VIGVRVFDHEGRMRLADLLAALDWALGLPGPPAVINLSLGLMGADGQPLLSGDPAACARDNPALAWVIAAHRARGTMVVAAAGDAGDPERVAVPACLAGVLAVGASGEAGPAPFANRGPLVRVWAPGLDVPVGGTTASGSSLAAARVSGEVAAGRRARGPW
jgi:serine protease